MNSNCVIRSEWGDCDVNVKGNKSNYYLIRPFYLNCNKALHKAY